MKRKLARRGAGILALTALVSATLVAAPSVAVAAESVPVLQWPAVDVALPEGALVSTPDGSITMPCSNYGSGGDLTTYSASGQVMRQIDRSVSIDGVKNCITNPVADKDGDVYGIPYGTTSSGSYARGPNILAYDGNTLKWKYPSQCNSNNVQVVVGGDGNIYSTTHLSDGVHLIGLAPELEAGQTQPTKVLDVKLPESDCSTQLFPYRDGLMLRGQNSGFRYYSYGGKLLTQPSVNRFWDAKINDRGHLFDFRYVSGSYASANVTMYDPLTGQVAWETPASTSGANVQGLSLYPLANGSVAALIREQKMVSDGIPTTPTEYIYMLVVLNASGQKLHAVPLPNSTGDPDPEQIYATIRAVATSDGKLAMIREAYIPTGLEYPSSVMGMQFSVFDPVAGTLTYSQEMHGELSQPAGPQSYVLEYSTEPSFVTAAGTLAFVAKCTRGICNGARKLYPVQVAGLGMDYPRGLVITAETPPQPAPINAAGLGDSYSSGQGAGRYDIGTTTSTNKCYKSAFAYGRLLHLNPYSPFSLSSFVACGGATTADIDQKGTYPGVQPQNTVLSSSVKAVILTMGGNDIGFADVVISCANPVKDCDGAFSLAESNLGMLGTNLQRIYIDILAKAPNATVYVLGYPPIVVEGDGCLVGNDGSDYPFFSEERKHRGVELLQSLNDVIETNVGVIQSLAGNSQRIKYIDPASSASPFTGHDVCASEPYVRGLLLFPGDTAESFHPGVKGHFAYSDLVVQSLE